MEIVIYRRQRVYYGEQSDITCLVPKFECCVAGPSDFFVQRFSIERSRTASPGAVLQRATMNHIYSKAWYDDSICMSIPQTNLKRPMESCETEQIGLLWKAEINSTSSSAADYTLRLPTYGCMYHKKIVIGINYLVSCIWFRVAVLCRRVAIHDDVIKWKQISALLALCEGHPPVTGGFPYNGQWRGASVFSLISVWTNGWTNKRNVGDFRYHRGYHYVTVRIDFNHILYGCFPDTGTFLWLPLKSPWDNFC